MQKIAQRCEYLLVEAADQKAESVKWSLTSRTGQVYDATLIVDEWTDAPMVELSDPDTRLHWSEGRSSEINIRYPDGRQESVGGLVNF